MFTADDLAHLAFLAGDWKGTAPDGQLFYERYDFPSPNRMRSQRFADSSFESASDGSTVSLIDGEVISQWGNFTWRAIELAPGLARFEPKAAPSAFSWRLVNANQVEVVQAWKDEQGQDQRYALILERVVGR